MKNGLLLWLALFLCADAFPQKSSDLFDGTAVRETDTLRGKISYDLQTNTVVIQGDGGVFTGSPRTVAAFEIFDPNIINYRKFYALPDGSAYYNNPVFFELLNDGKLTVLCREHIEQRTAGYSFYSYGFTENVLVVEYYMLNTAGKAEPLTSAKKAWLQLMSRKRDQVEEYAKKNKLQWANKYDLQKIVGYYNSLFLKP